MVRSHTVIKSSTANPMTYARLLSVKHNMKKCISMIEDNNFANRKAGIALSFGPVGLSCSPMNLHEQCARTSRATDGRSRGRGASTKGVPAHT